MNCNNIIKNLLILYSIIFIYYIIIHYVILHLTFILLILYNLLKGNNGKVKLERSRLRQLDNSRRNRFERG